MDCVALHPPGGVAHARSEKVVDRYAVPRRLGLRRKGRPALRPRRRLRSLQARHRRQRGADAAPRRQAQPPGRPRPGPGRAGRRRRYPVRLPGRRSGGRQDRSAHRHHRRRRHLHGALHRRRQVRHLQAGGERAPLSRRLAGRLQLQRRPRAPPAADRRPSARHRGLARRHQRPGQRRRLQQRELAGQGARSGHRRSHRQRHHHLHAASDQPLQLLRAEEHHRADHRLGRGAGLPAHDLHRREEHHAGRPVGAERHHRQLHRHRRAERRRLRLREQPGVQPRPDLRQRPLPGRRRRLGLRRRQRPALPLRLHLHQRHLQPAFGRKLRSERPELRQRRRVLHAGQWKQRLPAALPDPLPHRLHLRRDRACLPARVQAEQLDHARCLRRVADQAHLPNPRRAAGRAAGHLQGSAHPRPAHLWTARPAVVAERDHPEPDQAVHPVLGAHHHPDR